MAHGTYECIFPLQLPYRGLYNVVQSSALGLVFRGCSSAHRDWPDSFPPESLVRYIFSTSRKITNSEQMTKGRRIPIQVPDWHCGSETASPTDKAKKCTTYVHMHNFISRANHIRLCLPSEWTLTVKCPDVSTATILHP